MIKIKLMLNESPDKIFIKYNEENRKRFNLKNKVLSDDGNKLFLIGFDLLSALVFFSIENTLYYSGQIDLDYKTHYVLYKTLLTNKNLRDIIDVNDYVSLLNDYVKYPGRLWTSHKIISFWKNPSTKSELDNIINQLNELYNVQIDNSWYINVKTDKLYNNSSQRRSNWIPCSSSFKILKSIDVLNMNEMLIPINLFSSSFSKNLYSNILYSSHILTPMKKIFKKVYQKFKLLPKGMSQVLYNDMKTRYSYTLSLKESYTRLLLEEIYLKLNNNLDCSEYLFDFNLPDNLYKKILFHKNTNVNHINKSNNMTVLMVACRNTDKLKLLLSHPDIDINKQNTIRMTVLMVACYVNSILVVKILLAYPNIDVNLQDVEGFTAIDYAGSRQIKQLLKSHPGYKGYYKQ